MLLTLAFRHLLVRKVRSLFLLFGFSLGVGVMIVLLSVGQALLEQSRDVSLVGGGELTVLPQGIDVEAMRTGGASGMFFTINRARFLTRQVLGGQRHRAVVSAVAPAIEGKLLYLCKAGPRCRPVAVRAGGEIPSRARAVRAGLDLRAGTWQDSPADSAYIAPTPQQLYDELDRFHLPRSPDSAWAEWHYFTIVAGPKEWWYITYLVGGELPAAPPLVRAGARWGGRLLVTHHRADGSYHRFVADSPGERVALDTMGADLAIGASAVRQREGRYRVTGTASGSAGRARFDLTLTPLANRYFPAVELGEDQFRSGYVVPALAGSAEGTLCDGSRCSRVSGVPAYHDHNWGVWRDVTWEWGAARGERLSLLYGGIYAGRRDSNGSGAVAASPFFLTLVDSLGVLQVLRCERIGYQGDPPRRFTLRAGRDADSVRFSVEVENVLETPGATSAFRRAFLQMRGRFELTGRIAGQPVRDAGRGFFETYVKR